MKISSTLLGSTTVFQENADNDLLGFFFIYVVQKINFLESFDQLKISPLPEPSIHQDYSTDNSNVFDLGNLPFPKVQERYKELSSPVVNQSHNFEDIEDSSDDDTDSWEGFPTECLHHDSADEEYDKNAYFYEYCA